MLYTVSSRYRKAKDVCSHSRLFLARERPCLKPARGCHRSPGPQEPPHKASGARRSVPGRASPTGPANSLQELSLDVGAGTAASQEGQKRSLRGGKALQHVGIQKTHPEGHKYPPHPCPHLPGVQVGDRRPPKAVSVVFWGERQTGTLGYTTGLGQSTPKPKPPGTNPTHTPNPKWDRTQGFSLLLPSQPLLLPGRTRAPCPHLAGPLRS